MADEVIISEYTDPMGSPTGSVFGKAITSQVLDIAALSAAMNAATTMVRLQSKGTGFWYKQGESDVSAAADTDGSHWLPADQFVDLSITTNTNYIDTAADA